MTNAEIAEILAQALRLPSSERAAFLHEACGDDAALLARIQRMLKAFEESGAFPADERDAVRAVETALRSPGGLEGPGSKIGPYKLLQLIGEGGFGLVYMAEQHEPIRRKVALKIIKPGMDSREVIARFEAERQALALMDHPNIARVLDAGTVGGREGEARREGEAPAEPPGLNPAAVAWGRPYFVMELVRGVPLTEYCDRNQLSTRERLALFITVCQAVQHAHQKGIIHRDLKPSNILVTLHDGQPVPKVIDFGVAKALNQQLTEKTLFTAYGQMVGTPQYMSPEQAEMSGLDVDTRSDIYSLGVLLYELLTGTTPLDSQRLRSAGFAEMQRLIREEEPPRPSTRVSTLGEAATSVAQHRSVDPRRLRQELRGELDWIVMKALEKDRSRRYVAASGFVEDIQRYLRDEPVLACPPSAAYRFEKFARRNKVLLATLAAVALVLMAGAALSAMMASRAMRAERLARERLTGEIQARNDAEAAQTAETEQRRVAELERDRADAARQHALAELEHAQAAQRQAESNFQQARATVDQYLTTVSESQLLTVPGMQPLRQAMLDAALAFYERFVAERPQEPQLRAGLAAAYARLGRVASDLQQREQGQEYYGKAEELYEALMHEGNASPEVQRGLAEVYFWRRRTSEAISLCRRRLQEDPQDHAARHLLADAINTLAVGNDEDAPSPRYVLRLHRQAFAHRAALVAAEPDNPEFLRNLGGTINNVGVVLAKRGRERDALFQYRRGVEFAELAFRAAGYSAQHGRFLAIGRSNEAGYLARLGFVDAAIAARRRVAEVWLRLAQENPALPGLRAEASSAYRELANVQRQFGREDEAAETVLASRQLIENLPQETADDVYNLAVIYATLARDATRTPPADASPATADLREALRTLARAVALGFRNRATIEKEAAFAPLQDHPEFTGLLALLEIRQRIDAAVKATDPSKLSEVLALRDELQMIAHAPSASFLLAETHRTVGDYLMRVDQWALAQRDLDQALKLMPADEESDVDGRAASGTAVALERARTWQTLGQLHFRAQRYADAMGAWQSARTELERSMQKRPDDARVKEAVAALEYELAEAYGTLGACDGARFCRRAGEGLPRGGPACDDTRRSG
ncbi:MAG: serine/threonine protein kinase [Pirellulaceae bacterium]|nr:serine/threonine protein kinase [Pirellulaceae bacterium]